MICRWLGPMLAAYVGIVFNLPFLLVLNLAGCPVEEGTPVPDGAAQPGQPVPGGPPPVGTPGAEGGPPPGGEGGPPPGGEAGAEGVPAGEGAPPPEGGAAPGPFVPEPGAGGVTPPAPPVGLSSLVKDGKTITITGKLVGATEAQVDVQTVRADGAKSSPELLEIIKVTDGTFSIKAPATYDRPLYLTAQVHGPDGSKPSELAGAADPIKLEGKDISVEIKLTTGPEWLKKLPWGEGGMKPVGGAPPPPPDKLGSQPAGGTPPGPAASGG